MAGRKATLQFGLISLAIKLDTASVAAPKFSNMCTGQPGHDKHPAAPVKAPATCTVCDIVITDRGALVKGLKSGQTYTVINPEDITEAKEEFSAEYKGKLDLVPHPSADFLPDTAPGDSLHYITPADDAGSNHYQLLVKLISAHPELSFVSLHTPVSATSLYVVSVRSGVLVLEKRVRAGAMKPVPSVGGEVNEVLYNMLDTSLEMFVKPYDGETYEDGYRKAVDELIAAGEQVAASINSDPATVTAVLSGLSDEDLITKLKALKGA